MIATLILYFQFFTRIPIPKAIDQPMERMQQGVKYFSLFGFLVGIIEAVFFVAYFMLLKPPIAFILTLFTDILLTGGFHLDALADMSDGLFSARKSQRMLEIMKDSRIGSNGVLALIFYYLFLVGTFISYPEVHQLKTGVFLIVAFGLIGKAGISWLFYHMNYAGASEHGSGTIFMHTTGKDVFIIQAFTFVALWLMFSWRGVISYGIASIVIYFYRKMVLSKVPGFNGDTLGAAASIAQVVFFLSFCGLGSVL